MILALLAFLFLSPASAANFGGGGSGTPAGVTGQIQVNINGAFGAYAGFTMNGTTLATPGYLIASTFTANAGSPITIIASDNKFSGENGHPVLIRSGNQNYTSGSDTSKDGGILIIESGKASQDQLNADQYSGDVLIKTGDSSSANNIASNVGTVIIKSGTVFKSSNVGSSRSAAPTHTGVLIMGGYVFSSIHGANVEIRGSSGTVSAGDVIIRGGLTTTNFASGNVQIFGGNHGNISLTSTNGIFITGDISMSGTLNATHFVGEGSGITGVTAVVTPAGNNTDIQYNNSGALGATDNFQWDDANRVLKIDTVEFGWKKYSFDYTAFATASTSTEVTLFTLAPGAIIEGVKIKHSSEFTGGAISTYTLSVGLTGDSSKYASAFDVFSAVGSTNFQLTQDFFSEDHDNPTTVIVKALSQGDNLDQAAQGNVEIWVKTSVAN